MANSTNPILDAYKHNAFDVMHFKLVREKEDLDNIDGSFTPDMTHQVFGSSETIFGYKDLQINIFCMSGSLSMFVDIKFSEEIPSESSVGVEPDDILKAMHKVYDQELYTSKTKFMEEFENEFNFKPFGKLKNGYTLKQDGQSREFAVYYLDDKSEDFTLFTDYLKRMEPFLLFFVDGSNFITLDDRWCFYIVYEKFTASNCSRKRYAFAGYLTVYNFYAYPEHLRPRVSQALILPPFQGIGNASRLLECVYDDYINLPEVIDITVEEPSEDFQRIRDFLDCKRCLQLYDFVKILTEKPVLTNCGNVLSELDENNDDSNGQPRKRRCLSTQSLAKSTADQFTLVAREQLKLCRKQSRKIYEILRLFMLPRNNAEATKMYKVALLKRNQIIYNRIRVDAMRGESQTVKSQEPPAQRIMKDILEEQYVMELHESVNAQLTAYENVIKKLDAAIENGEIIVDQAIFTMKK